MTATEVIDVTVPDIGDFDEVPVIEILVGPGDTVAVDDPLVTLESDKATMDIPAPFAGVVNEVMVSIGDRVAQGSLLLTLDSGGNGAKSDARLETRASAVESEAAPVESAAPDSVGAATAAEAASAPAVDDASDERPGLAAGTPPAPSSGNGTAASVDGPVYASPSVRRVARELGVDLSRIRGSGRKGRITKADLETAGGRESGAPAPAATGAGGAGGSAGVGEGIAGLDIAPWPKVNFEKFGPVERVARTRIQNISAPNLARNWVMIPHVTHNDEADITDLEAFRKRLNDEHARDGVKLTMLGFLIAASVATLKEFPTFNSSLDGQELALKRYYNIGFAADTPGGLVVPVIKDADKIGILDIARELTELSGKAREGKLGPADMSGGTFTISSLGGIGGTSFTPIINAPEVAILGVTRSATKPVWDGGAFKPRLMVPLSLSYDHRVIDGAAAARFMVHLVEVLSDLRRAML